MAKKNEKVDDDVEFIDADMYMGRRQSRRHHV